VLGDDEIDAPAGTFVMPIRERSGAVAWANDRTGHRREAGGARDLGGRTSKSSSAFTEREAEAREQMEKVLADSGRVAGPLQRGCFEALTGSDDAAIEQLKRAIDSTPKRSVRSGRLGPLGDRRSGTGLCWASAAFATGRTYHERHRACRSHLQVPQQQSWAMVRTHPTSSRSVSAYIGEGGRGRHPEAPTNRQRGQHELCFVSSGTRRSRSTA
jgi:hypothetical protein